MTPTKIADPNVTVKNLLLDNWDPANVVGNITPEIHTGWYNHGSNQTQFTLPFGSVDEDEATGGAAPYSGLAGSAGPVQDWNGTIIAVAWAHHEMSDVEAAGLGFGKVKDLLWDFYWEAKRIIRTQFAGTGGLDSLLVGGQTRGVDTDYSPVAFRMDIPILYTRRELP